MFCLDLFRILNLDAWQLIILGDPNVQRNFDGLTRTGDFTRRVSDCEKSLCPPKENNCPDWQSPNQEFFKFPNYPLLVKQKIQTKAYAS